MGRTRRAKGNLLMPNYAEYFERIAYKPTWFIGDRVFGYYKKIPFMGTVGNDTLINEIEGPRVSVFLDLPMKIDKEYKSIIIVKPKDLKRLKDLDDIAVEKSQPGTGKRVDKKSNGSTTTKSRR
jgi:hypothetical protein